MAILDWNSHHYAEAYYACALMGLTFMPLNSRLAAPELEHIFNDSDARALLLSEPFAALYNDIKAKAPSLEIFIGIDLSSNHDNIHDYEDLLSKSSDTVEAANAGIDDIIQIYYTSGTTGDPKGVCLTNANIYCCGLDCLGHYGFLDLGQFGCTLHPCFILRTQLLFGRFLWSVGRRYRCISTQIRFFK